MYIAIREKSWMAFFIPENESKGGDTRMMHLFVGMLLGILVGLAVGSACASLAWAKAEIRRLKRELRKEYGYADEQK